MPQQSHTAAAIHNFVAGRTEQLDGPAAQPTLPDGPPGEQRLNVPVGETEGGAKHAGVRGALHSNRLDS
jgi:hypothetical protein